MNIVVYRNCFTGDVSGGDMHMAGVLRWLSENKQETISLVRAHNDGQSKVYEDVLHVKNVRYWAPRITSPALSYILRTFFGLVLPRLPYKAGAKNVLIASSHFLPDVVPVAFKLRRKKCERVVYIHHVVQDMSRTPSFATKLAVLQERFCFYVIKKHFQKVIVVNKAVKRRLRQLGFTEQTISVSSNFASSEPLPVVTLDQKNLTLLFCGRLVKQKGIYDFLETCRFLKQHIPDFSAAMIGAGPEEDRIRHIVKDEQLPIEVAGRISEADKQVYYNRAQLFVFPSMEEGWGIVVAESLGAGTPVLVYDLPVYREIFDQNLHVVAQGDVTTLRKKALSLLQKYHSQPNHYQLEQDRIAKYAQQFTKANIAESEYNFLTS